MSEETPPEGTQDQEPEPAEQEPEPPTEPPQPRTGAHPSAPYTSEEDLAAGRNEHGEYFIGMWSGIPLYGCPSCSFSTTEGNGAVEFHVDSRVNSGDPKHWLAKVKEGEAQ